MGKRVKDYENLSDTNIRKVISLLEGSPPITKKEACEILNISYNTSRLNKIIEEYRAAQENSRRLRDKKRGKPVEKDEVHYIVTEYVSGTPLQDISKSIYRSVAFIKALIENIGVPQRVSGEEKHQIAILPENCIAEDFNEGDIAWSALYHAPCKIIRRLEDDKYIPKYGAPCYNIWVIENSEDSFAGGGFFASQISYDLGKLDHLKEYGISLNGL